VLGVPDDEVVPAGLLPLVGGERELQVRAGYAEPPSRPLARAPQRPGPSRGRRPRPSMKSRDRRGRGSRSTRRLEPVHLSQTPSGHRSSASSGLGYFSPGRGVFNGQRKDRKEKGSKIENGLAAGRIEEVDRLGEPSDARAIEGMSAAELAEADAPGRVDPSDVEIATSFASELAPGGEGALLPGGVAADEEADLAREERPDVSRRHAVLDSDEAPARDSLEAG
jgi:hypothetical protein